MSSLVWGLLPLASLLAPSVPVPQLGEIIQTAPAQSGPVGEPALPKLLGWGDGYVSAYGPNGLIFRPSPSGLETAGGAWQLAPLHLPLNPVRSPRQREVWHSQAQQGTLTVTPNTPFQLGKEQVVPLALEANLLHPDAAQVVRAGPPFSLPLSIHPHLPVAGPIKLGQPYLWLGGKVKYQQNGKVLAYSALAGRVLTLKHMSETSATFEAEGLGLIERLGPLDLSDLAPLIEDPDLGQLQKQYEGKTVWAYGGLGGSCSPTAKSQIGLSAPVHAPLKILRVLRLARPLELNVQGGVADGAEGADLLSLNPLVLLIDFAAFKPSDSFAFQDEESSDDPQAMIQRIEQLQGSGTAQCGAAFALYLPDTWAIERVLSLKPPPADLFNLWHRPAKGLNRWQYAWYNGFPDGNFGTRDELLQQPVWYYRNIPFAISVTFDSQGQVSDVDVPRLP